MIDFHTHILPGIDDGAKNVQQSLLMLHECYRQGIDRVFLTPHFYADSDDPEHFVHKRNRAYQQLCSAIDGCSFEVPELFCGAEVLYFPGMSYSEELSALTLGDYPFILIEPPMMPWTDSMINEIEQTGVNLRCIPIIAHIDRYMTLLNDYSLIHRVQDRRMLVQVNSSFFINKSTRSFAFKLMNERKFQFLGSDCHNLTDRPPNLHSVFQIAKSEGVMNEFIDFSKREYVFFQIG